MLAEVAEAFAEPSSDGVVTGLVTVGRAAAALERLDMSGCQVPPASLAALRAALPGVTVDG